METISLFPDGSCNTAQRIGAWACIVLLPTGKKILSGSELDTTHQRMELLSVIHGLDFVRSQNARRDIIIFTDSQYVERLYGRKDKLRSGNFTTKGKKLLPNTDLLIRLFDYFDKFAIQIVKVRAHKKASVEEQMNSSADKLCRQLVRKLVDKK